MRVEPQPHVRVEPPFPHLTSGGTEWCVIIAGHSARDSTAPNDSAKVNTLTLSRKHRAAERPPWQGPHAFSLSTHTRPRHTHHTLIQNVTIPRTRLPASSPLRGGDGTITPGSAPGLLEGLPQAAPPRPSRLRCAVPCAGGGSSGHGSPCNYQTGTAQPQPSFEGSAGEREGRPSSTGRVRVRQSTTINVQHQHTP